MGSRIMHAAEVQPGDLLTWPGAPTVTHRVVELIPTPTNEDFISFVTVRREVHLVPVDSWVNLEARDTPTNPER